MAYGGMILRNNGTEWLNPDQTPLNMVKREDVYYGSNAAVQYYDSGVSNNRPCAMFFRITSGDQGQHNVGGYLVQRNGTWQYQLNGTQGPINVRWYVFSNYVVAPTAYDIVYYNASGNAVWNGSSRPLQLFSAYVPRNNAVQNGYTVLDAGETVAIVPSFSGTAVENYIPGVPPTYYIATYCYKAVGNRVVVDLAEMTTQYTDGYVPYYIGMCFYIKTRLYDY